MLILLWNAKALLPEYPLLDSVLNNTHPARRVNC